MAATASRLGYDHQELVLNPESIRQARAKYRASLTRDIRNSFNSEARLVVQWDDKIVPDDDGTTTDRLVIIVTSEGVEKLLGVPKLYSGIGEAVATAVCEVLEDWGL